jgi:hypothetical protein
MKVSHCRILSSLMLNPAYVQLFASKFCPQSPSVYQYVLASLIVSTYTKCLVVGRCC